jgi:hypothetical protein
MKWSEKSIFAMSKPPLWRIGGANLLIWALSAAFWWRTLQIEDMQSIPSSRRFGPLTSDIAFLLGTGFLVCAVWALWEVKRAPSQKWSASVRFGLLAAIAGIGTSAAAMIAVGQRIWALGN